MLVKAMRIVGSPMLSMCHGGQRDIYAVWHNTSSGIRGAPAARTPLLEQTCFLVIPPPCVPLSA